MEKWIILIIIIGILIVPTIIAVDTSDAKSQANSFFDQAKANLREKTGRENAPSIESGEWTQVHPSLKFLKYFFGPLITPTGLNLTSAGAITFSIWLLIFVSFSDIIASFSSFSKSISWIIGFCLALIAANLQWTLSIIKGLTGAFAVLGAFALVVGLLAGFVAFLIVNLGITGLGWWVMNRKEMMEAHKIAGKAEAKGVELAGGLKAQHRITEGILDEGGGI